MLVLFETSAGYALFKIKDGKKGIEDIGKAFREENTSDLVKLKGFNTFKDTKEALKGAVALSTGELAKPLKNFLKEHLKKKGESIVLGDSRLASEVSKKFKVETYHNSGAVLDIMRGLRTNIEELLKETLSTELDKATLGLSHSVSRHKLRFTPDKIDNMIIQTISFLDDLDKELNVYGMRLKEWYGWHFPELTSIVTDNLIYAKTVLCMGEKDLDAKLDEILPEDLEEKVRNAIKISMGTEMSEEDIEKVKGLAEQVETLSSYRNELYDYLINRMRSIAPNISELVGELVGARLIAHAGSLMNLAKLPASTIQLLGAEKALFRALKSKQNTPKYGIIYHASLVGQVPAKHKGKISRVLAAKTALVARMDALAEEEDSKSTDMGSECRQKVEKRVAQVLRQGNSLKNSTKPPQKPQPIKSEWSQDNTSYKRKRT